MKEITKLNIAFIHNNLDVQGGAERKMLLIAQHLNNIEGVNLQIFVNKFDKEKTFKEYLNGLRITEIKGNKVNFCLKAAKLTKDFDIIHCHNHPGHLAGAISKILKNKPVLWFCNEPILYLAGTEKRQSRIKLFFIRLIEKIFLSLIDVIVTNSQNTRNNVFKFLNKDSEVIYSGIDSELLKPGIVDEEEILKILLVARLEKEKNIDFILETAKDFQDFKFIIAGRGSQEKHLRETISNSGLKNVELLVNVSEEKKINLYQTSDIFACPTLREPLGINIVEAMSCALPVVAFNSGGAKETVANGKTGFLADSEEEFKEKIKVLTGDEGLRAMMGEEGRQRAIEVFSLEQMFDKTIDLYKKLLAKYGKDFEFNPRSGQFL